MCIICVEFQKGKMTTGEATRALVEMAPTLGDHVLEVQDLIKEKVEIDLVKEQMDLEFEAMEHAVRMNDLGTVHDAEIEADREYHLDEGATD